MHEIATAASPALTVAVALAAGMLAQIMAHHLRLPGIVLLVAAGTLLGPDLLGLVHPDSLGTALHDIIGFAVTVILFEGGLSLSWKRIREQAAPIRLLLSAGVAVTTVGGMLAARFVLGWSWNLSLLFGTLVIVTGPTVVTPLLRRLRVQRKLETILESEGVLIDGIGAIIAVVTLELVLASEGSARLAELAGGPARLALGGLFGLVGGGLLVLLLRWRSAIPADLENVFTLAMVLGLAQVANSLVAESGIVAAIVAGMVVGNVGIPVQRELREFKEQLTVLFIGLLFVLLAADVRIGDVFALGWPGLTVAAILMFIVRPVGVAVATMASDLDWRQRFFLAWLAPRGIVAAAVASLFAERLHAAGVPGGEDLRAMVFLVIGVTVFFQGLSAGPLAGALGLKRPSNQGFAILGANALGVLMGKLLAKHGEKVVMIDASAGAQRPVEEAGLRLVYGNALEDRVLRAAGVESRRAVVAVLPDGATNLLFARKARREFQVPVAMVAVPRGTGAIEPEMVRAADAHVLFVTKRDIELWIVRVRRETARAETWIYGGSSADKSRERGEKDATGSETSTGSRIALPATGPFLPDGSGATGDGGKDHPLLAPREIRSTMLPLVHRRGEQVAPVDDTTDPRPGDAVIWLVYDEKAAAAAGWLEATGWRRDGGAV